MILCLRHFRYGLYEHERYVHNGHGEFSNFGFELFLLSHAAILVSCFPISNCIPMTRKNKNLNNEKIGKTFTAHSIETPIKETLLQSNTQHSIQFIKNLIEKIELPSQKWKLICFTSANYIANIAVHFSKQMFEISICSKMLSF